MYIIYVSIPSISSISIYMLLKYKIYTHTYICIPIYYMQTYIVYISSNIYHISYRTYNIYQDNETQLKKDSF